MALDTMKHSLTFNFKLREAFLEVSDNYIICNLSLSNVFKLHKQITYIIDELLLKERFLTDQETYMKVTVLITKSSGIWFYNTSEKEQIILTMYHIVTIFY